MSNYRRCHIPGGAFFFTVATRDRAPVFADERHVAALRRALRQVKATRPFAIDAMVVLPDHLHCIWRLPTGDGDYSSRWREIKKAASRLIAPASDVRRERAVWQRRFWEHAIRDDEDWRRHVDYIHFNPVKHGLVRHPLDWPWSSLRAALARGWYEASWGDVEPEGVAGVEWE